MFHLSRIFPGRHRFLRYSAFLLTACLAVPTHATTVVFSENFGVRGSVACEPAFPSGWTRYNVDGLTPDTTVSWVNDAWVVKEDIHNNATDCVAFSNSYYSPAGVADDWLVTPQIAIPTLNPKLTFRAITYDPLYPESYEVRWATTSSVAAFLANSALLTVTGESSAWTAHEIDLSALGGQSVYLAFHNKSNDKWLLAVDDVKVTSIPTHDGKLDSVLRPHAELQRLATILGTPLQLGARVSNNGAAAITNVVVTAHVKLDGTEIHSVAASAVASLASGATADVTMTPYTVTQSGSLTVEYTLAIAETDDDTSNNALTSAALLVSELEQGRDDGTMAQQMGIGAAGGGLMGSIYHLDQAAYVRAIRIYTAGTSTDLAGNQIVAEIRSVNGTTGKPDGVLATTQAYTVPSPPVAGYVDLKLAAPLWLTAGDYYFGVIEAAHDAGQNDTLDIGFAAGFYKAGRNWTQFTPGAPAWVNMETLSASFQRAPMLRVLYTRGADLSIGKTAPATVSAGAAFSYTLQVDNAGPDPAENLVLTDPLPSGASFVSASGSGWSCSASGGTLTCTRSSLAVGTGPAITVNLTAPDAIGTFATTANVVADTGDPDGSITATASTAVSSPATVTASKSVSGSLYPGGSVTYTITLSNSASTAQQDNTGNEFNDVLPAELTLTGAAASSGTAVATLATNTVTWNGRIPANGTVTLTITATIPAATPVGTQISSQGVLDFDADGNGSNESSGQTDDPAIAGVADATLFEVGAIPSTPTPTASANPDPGPLVSAPGASLTLTGSAPVTAQSGSTLIIPSGANVAGTLVTLAAPSGGNAVAPVTLMIGGATLTLSHYATGTVIGFKKVSINGVETPVLTVTSGTLSLSGGAGQPLLTLGGNATLTAGTAGTAINFSAGNDGSGSFAVSGGYLVLTANAFAEIRDGKLYAGEVANFDAAGKITGVRLGSLDGKDGQLGDPLGGEPVRVNLHGKAARDPSGLDFGDALAALIGQGAANLGQNGNGVLRLKYSGGTLNALPLGGLSIDTSRPDGVVIRPDGVAEVALAGIVATFVPAVAALEELRAALPNGTTVAMSNEGVLSIGYAGKRRWVRPAWVSQADDVVGVARTAQGLRYADGKESYTLFPAFADYAALRRAVGAEIPAATFQANPDGSVSLGFADEIFVLTADLDAADPGPDGFNRITHGERWWQDASGKLFLNAGSVQGFNVK